MASRVTKTYLALGIAVVFGLVGCGTESGGSGPTSGASGGAPVTISYATPAEDATFDTGERPLIEQFQRDNPNIKVEVKRIPTADYNSTLTTELRGGAGPDLGRVNHTDIQTFAAGGFLQPLDDTITANGVDVAGLIPGLVDTGKYDGGQVTLPLITDTRVLYYNPKVLKSKGIDAPAATWSELVDHVSKFAGGKVYGYAFQTDSDYAMAYETVGPYMKAAGGEILTAEGESATAVAGTSAGTAAAVSLLQDIVATGAVPPGIDNNQLATTAQLFSQDKLAYTLGGPWVKASLLENNPDLTYGTDYATAPVPVQNAGDASASTAGGWQIGIFKNTKNAEAAGKLLAFMLQRDNLISLNKIEGFPPVQDGLSSEPWVSDEFYRAFNEVLPKSGLPIVPVTRLAEVAAAFEKNVRPAVIEPDTDVAKALTTFDTEVNDGILQ